MPIACTRVEDDRDGVEFAEHQNAHVKLMLELVLSIAAQLLQRYLVLVRFREPGLVLADRPLALYQRPENRPSVLGVGISTADELWLPLDRRTAVILHGDVAVGERVIKMAGSTAVRDFNQVIVHAAHREVYCHPDDVRRLSEVDLPEANRPRLQGFGSKWVRGKTDGVNYSPGGSDRGDNGVREAIFLACRAPMVATRRGLSR